MTRLLASVVLLVMAALAAAPGARADALCGPFVTSTVAAAAVDAIDEQGVTFDASGAGDPGSIVRLEAAGSPDAAAAERESEAILALPKNEAGKIPTDFELGPKAEIRASFFSPVICATVARIAGPPGTSLDQLVTVVPEGSALVPNDVYASASTEVKPVEARAPEPDPYVTLQYGLAISGVREARELSSGAGVRIALLDSAPETDHRDLSATRIQPISQGESLPVGVHGTLMAGVINAIEGNGFGIAGMAPDAELVSIPICRPRGAAGGECTIYDLLQGLDQAWDAEAAIVNLSLSGPPNVLLERGVARLESLGAVVVAAAGNEGTSEKRYPAAYPSVIGVGAVDREGRPFSGSNRGSWVEIVAPGVDVLSTVPGDAFAFGNGTSLAAAHVTGTLAVLTSVTGDAKLARGELFRAMGARQNGRRREIPPVCEVLARVSRSCGGAETGADDQAAN